MSKKTASSRGELPRILVCDPIHADGIELLRKNAHVDMVDKPALTTAELEDRIGDYHAVINRSRTSIPGSVIRKGRHLRIIARAGAGLDNIDLDAANEMEIKVVNCPDANTVAVAEHTFALMLGLARHIPQADQSMKNGLWAKSALLGDGLAGKTLGIVGFGRIGREVAKRAKAFGMNVVVNQNRLTPELAHEWRVENVDLIDLLECADFVSIHVPMRPENVGLIGEQELSHLKPTAYIINTARGGIIDEDALLQALDAGKIAGAGLDVFINEPNNRSDLAGHAKVLASPHIGASTLDAQRKVAIDAAKQVLDTLQGQSASEVLSLRVVPVDEIYPHEYYHPPRVDRLAERIANDQMLINPPLVADLGNGNGYVVLDGATRTTAFKQLGYPHMVVQTIDVERDNVQLFSWSHVVRDNANHGGIDNLLEILHTLPDLHLAEMPPEHLEETMRAKGALGYLITTDQRGYLLELDRQTASRPATTKGPEIHDWLDVLNTLVGCCGDWGDIERTLHRDIGEVRTMFPDAVALIVFPVFTPDVVLQIAKRGDLLPAGITRFVVPGRILRLNVPLAELISDEPISLKHDWLDRFVQAKLGDRQARYYEEPIVLFDE